MHCMIAVKLPILLSLFSIHIVYTVFAHNVDITHYMHCEYDEINHYVALSIICIAACQICS